MLFFWFNKNAGLCVVFVCALIFVCATGGASVSAMCMDVTRLSILIQNDLSHERCNELLFPDDDEAGSKE